MYSYNKNDYIPEYLTETFDIKIGPIEVYREMHTPTIESLDSFYNIIKTKEWFDSYDYAIVGSFANVLKNKQQWRTWDVDMTVSGHGNSSLKEIKRVLIELTEIAVIECGFYLDVYYVSSDIEINKKHNYPFGLSIDSLNPINTMKCMMQPSWQDIIQQELMNGIHPENIFDNFSELYKYPKVLNISIGLFKDGKNQNTWPHGKEVYDGLWERYINFPSVKAMKRMIHGYVYEGPIEVKRYYKNR